MRPLGAVSRHSSIQNLDRCMAPGDDTAGASWTATAPTAAAEAHLVMLRAANRTGKHISRLLGSFQ